MVAYPYSSDDIDVVLNECRERAKKTGAPLREGVIQVAIRTAEHEVTWTNTYGEVANGFVAGVKMLYILWRESMMKGRNYREARYHPLSLLLDCKSIYNEAILIFYRVALFYIFKRRDLAWFLNIPEQFQKAIADVRMSRITWRPSEVEKQI